MRDETYTPFKGKRVSPASVRVLHRFRKAGHIAEIRERAVTVFRALEFIVFIDDQLSESQMFHGARLQLYAQELETRRKQFIDGAWIEDPTVTSRNV